MGFSIHLARFLFDLKAQLASTITSACPSCRFVYAFVEICFKYSSREDETPWIGQLLMLYAMIWESYNGRRPGSEGFDGLFDGNGRFTRNQIW